MATRPQQHTTSTYLLVYLLTCVHFNVLVPVKAYAGLRGPGGQPDETSSDSSQASTPKTGVDLNIKSDKKTTKKFECEKRGNIVTYTPKGDNAFKLVKEDKTELWEATDARNYSDRIEVDLLNNDSKALTVYLGDKTKVFKKDGIHKLWKEIDTTKVHPASINIDYPHECYSYKNELKGRIRTFTAKTGFAFNCANEYVNNNKFEIWKTDQESEYANKIEVNLIDNDSTALTVYLAGNKTRVFKKDGKNEPWTEIDTTKVHPTSININYPDESYLYKNELRGNFRIFTAKTGFAFKGANEYVDDKKFEIWKTNFESEYVNKIEVDIINKDSRAVTIHLGENKTRVFMRSGMNEPWKEIDKSKPNPISVYINYPHESYSYKNELKDRIRTFTTKKGFAIKCANEYIDDENRNEIWRTDNENEYVNKIEVDLISYESRAVTIFMGDGKTRIFMRNGNNEPWKEIDKSKVNPKPINISYPFETYFYKNQLKGETRTITPKKAFAFKGVVEYVRNKKVEIWRADNDSEYSEKVVSEGNNKVTIYIGNDGTAKVFNKGSDGKWTEDCSGGIKATETDYETQPSSSAAESSSETGWSSETDREDGDVKAGGISPEFSISQNGGGKYPANKEVGSTEGLIDGIYPTIPCQSVYNEPEGPTASGYGMQISGHVMTSDDHGMPIGAYGMRSDALHPEDDMMDGRYTMPTPGHGMPSRGPYRSDPRAYGMPHCSHGMTRGGGGPTPVRSLGIRYEDHDPIVHSMPYDRYGYVHGPTPGSHGMKSGEPYSHGPSGRMPSSGPYGSDPSGRPMASVGPFYHDVRANGMVSPELNPTGHGPTYGGRQFTSSHLPYPHHHRMSYDRGRDVHAMPTPDHGMIAGSSPERGGPYGSYQSAHGMTTGSNSMRFDPHGRARLMSPRSHGMPTAVEGGPYHHGRSGHSMPKGRLETSGYGLTSGGLGLPAQKGTISGRGPERGGLYGSGYKHHEADEYMESGELYDDPYDNGASGHGMPTGVGGPYSKAPGGHFVSSDSYGIPFGGIHPEDGLESEGVSSEVHVMPQGVHVIPTPGHAMSSEVHVTPHSIHVLPTPGNGRSYRSDDHGHGPGYFGTYYMASSVPYGNGHSMSSYRYGRSHVMPAHGHRIIPHRGGPERDGSFGREDHGGQAAGRYSMTSFDSDPSGPMPSGVPYNRDCSGYGMVSRDLDPTGLPMSSGGSYDRDPSAHGMAYDRYVHPHHMTPNLQAQERMSSGISFGPEHQDRDSSYRTLPSGGPYDRDVHPHGMRSGAPYSHDLSGRMTSPRSYGMPMGETHSHGPSGHMPPGGYGMTSGASHPEHMMAGSHTVPTPGHGLTTGASYHFDNHGHGMPAGSRGMEGGYVMSYGGPFHRDPSGYSMSYDRQYQGLDPSDHDMSHGINVMTSPGTHGMPSSGPYGSYPSGHGMPPPGHVIPAGRRGLEGGYGSTDGGAYDMSSACYSVPTDGSAENGFSSSHLLKPFKDDGSGKPVEMVEYIDFEKKRAYGDDRYEFKPNVKCILVMFGEHKVWKKGDHGVNEPNLVAFNDNVKIVAIRDNDRTVLFKKGTNNDTWAHYNTVERQQRPSARPRTESYTPKRGSLSSSLSSSLTSLDTGSPGTPQSLESLNEDDTASFSSGGDVSTDQSRRGSDDIHACGESGYGSRGTTLPSSGADSQSSDEDHIVATHTSGNRSSNESNGTYVSTDSSAPVTTPATNLRLSRTMPLARSNESKSSTNLSGGSSATVEVKLFKDDGNGNAAEMEGSDFSQNNHLGYRKYEFKSGVKCVLVMIEDAELWKKGENDVEEPKTVSYNFDTHNVVLFDGEKFVFYKTDDSGNWIYHRTIDAASRSAGHSSQAGSLGSTLSSSTAKPEAVSTVTPESSEYSGETHGTSSVSPAEGCSTQATPGTDTLTGGESSGDGPLVSTPPSGGADGQSSDEDFKGGGAESGESTGASTPTAH